MLNNIEPPLRGFADIIKSVYYGIPAILSSGVSSALVLASRNPAKFHPIQSKKAVNALWDMYIPPQSVHPWIALFGGISYSAWALLAYSYRDWVLQEPLLGE